MVAMVGCRVLGPSSLLLTVLVGCAGLRRHPAPASAPAPAVDEGAQILGEGTPAPEVSALDDKGNPVPLSRYRGKLLVLYFYPMDFAAGATAQANEFREDFSKYRGLGATVVGVSMDDPETHRQFAERYKLPFPLLSDPQGEVARAFGVPITASTTRHVTFIVDKSGVIRTVWRKVHPWGHSAQVLSALKQSR
jgi:thioredoxin-dependent peroxiredoxin